MGNSVVNAYRLFTLDYRDDFCDVFLYIELPPSSMKPKKLRPATIGKANMKAHRSRGKTETQVTTLSAKPVLGSSRVACLSSSAKSKGNPKCQKSALEKFRLYGAIGEIVVPLDDCVGAPISL